MKLIALLGLVTVAYSFSIPSNLAVSDCDVCKDSMKSLGSIIDNKQNQAEVKGWLISICDGLGGDRATQCKHYVNEFYDNVIQLISVQLKEACDGYWGYCYDADHCKVCKDWSASIKKIIDDPTAQKTIKSWFVQYCKALPAEASTMCMNTLDADFDKTIKDLDNLFATYCTDRVGVCQQQTAKSVFLDIIKTQVAVRSIIPFQLDTAKCDTCHQSAKAAKTIVDDTKVQDQVKVWLKQVCDSLPAKAADTCNKRVDQFFPNTIKLLDIFFDISCDWGICYNAENCKTCKDVTYSVKVIVDKPSNQDDVKNWFLQYCKGLPGTYASDCTDAVHQYFGLIKSGFDLVLNIFCTDIFEVCKQ